MKRNNYSALTPFAKSALLIILAAGSVHAQILNSSFESGTNGWTSAGGAGNFTTPTSYVGSYQTINPVDSTHLGLITDSGVFTQSISQTFTLGAGSQNLYLSYLFLTDEYNDPFFNPVASATLTPTIGGPITLFSISRNDLQAAGAGPLLPGASFIDVQTIGQSAWQNISTDISAFAGQTVTLSFNLDNNGDSDFLFDSQLGIDNIHISTVPEPGAGGFLVLGFGIFGALKFRRIRATPPAQSPSH